MWRVFVEGGQYACMFGADNAFDAVTQAMGVRVLLSRKVIAVTCDEDPMDTARRVQREGRQG